MAVPEMGTDVLAREKMSKKQKAADKKLVATAQDIKYARFLSDNDAKTRDRALKSLRRWVQHRCQSIQFTELDLMLIWKGLFYSMWMSDKLLVQEECAENISHLIHSLTPDQALLYFKCGLKLLGNEWFGIDQHRLDKFMMLVRRLLRQALEVVKNQNWNPQFVKKFERIIEETIMSTSNKQPIGLCLHFTEIYLEELSKISEGKISESILTQFVTPFIKQLAFSNETRLLGAILKYIFTHLMNQSDIGIEHAEKFANWQRMRFVGGNIDKIQKVAVSDDEEVEDESDEDDVPVEKGVLDPRAGKVDIVLPQLKFSSKQIINIAQKYRYHPESTNHSRKVITKLIDDFTEMSRGKYPLGLKKIDLPKKDNHMKVKQSLNRLVTYKQKIVSENRKNVFDDGENEEADRPKGKKRRIDDDLGEQLDHILGKNRKKKKKPTNEVWNVEVNMVVNGDDSPKTIKTKKSMQDVVEVPTKKSKVAKNAEIIKLRKKSINYTNENKYSMNESAFEACINNFETAFVRNSGLWNVFNKGDDTMSESSVESEDIKPSSIKIDSPKSNSPKTKVESPKKIVNSPKKPSPIKTNGVNGETFKPDEMSTPKKSVFPQSEWDAPLQEGETEIFIPYKKFVNRSEHKPSILQQRSIKQLKGKNRLSLDPNLVRNPFSSTPKKVKINLRLNKSQEVHEHVAQIKSSPAIPFDADRKPEKPLLKANAVASPINPFYKRKLNI